MHSSAASSTMNFRTLYREVALPKLREALKQSNALALPRVTAVVVQAGVGKHRTEGKFLEDATKGLTLITGQKPVTRLARKSIAGFKLRAGQVAGLLVTLRGRRMEDFLARLLWVALPRVRDFRGIPARSVDAQGNLSIGIREASVFPEADPATVETPFGFQVTLCTTARNREEALLLFRSLGFPLAEADRADEKRPRARPRVR